MKHWWKNTVAYIQDNPEGYWFKAKLYGWGWVPVRWQGWLVTLVAVAAVLYLGYRFEQQPGNMLLEFIFPLLVIIGILILICRKTGESPKWQWGPPPAHTDENESSTTHDI